MNRKEKISFLRELTSNNRPEILSLWHREAIQAKYSIAIKNASDELLLWYTKNYGESPLIDQFCSDIRNCRNKVGILDYLASFEVRYKKEISE